MKTNLKKHNVEPVKKVLDAFNAGEQRVALAHATGTGKSYATCAIIELGNFKNVLYLSPSNHINKYFERVVIKNLGNRQAINILATYSFLLHRDLKSLAGKYDLIVLDEYHRLGAREWGKAAKDLLELNPQAKILGLTATEVRYLDNWRNMSDELNFKVISTITLVDAIERRILPAPIYIIGFSNFNIIIKELEDLAIKCKTDKEYLEEIKKLKVDWINSKGLAGIVERHLPITTSKIVVFSEAIERYDDIVKKMTEILTAAGFKNLKFLRADSNTKDSVSNIEYFSTNNDKNEVKVIVSVNMLNEGIHAEGAEACFMFRKTKSATIFLQQLGRVESSLDPKKKPIVFDLVNNISNDWELFTQIGLNQVGKTTKINPICVRRIFGIAGINVYSYVEAYVEMKEKLNRLFRTLNLDGFEELCKTKGRIPERRGKERHYYNWMWKRLKKGDQKVIELYNYYKVGEDYKVWFSKLKTFVEVNKRLPSSNKYGERKLYEWMMRRVKSGDPKVIEIYENYRKRSRKDYETMLRLYKNFLIEHGRNPSSQIEEELNLYRWYSQQVYRGNKEVIALHVMYRNRRIPLYEERFAEFLDFVNRENRLPRCSSARGKREISLYNWMHSQLRKGNQEVIDLYNRFNPDKPWKG